MILTPLQKLPKNGEDWGKIIVAKCFKGFPKSKISPNLVTLVVQCRKWEKFLSLQKHNPLSLPHVSKAACLNQPESQKGKFGMISGAAIAPWFRLCLPSCGPGFESQAHHLRFFKKYNFF